MSTGRISMRTNLEVLNSFDLIMTTSTMQSADESVSVREVRETVTDDPESIRSKEAQTDSG